MMRPRAAFTLVSGILLVVACGTAATRPEFDDTVVDAGPDAGETPPGDEAGSLFEDAAPLDDLGPKGTWTGTVLTPAGDIPVSGALVYLATKKPDPIPSGNFCNTCLQLEATYPQTLTKADGSFSLVANRLGRQYFIIQKGQFRRIVEVDVKEGDVTVAKGDSKLPLRDDTSKGDQVPSILLSKGMFDDIGATLAKLGIAPTKVVNEDDEVTVLSDSALLAKHHVVFLPCGDCVTGPTSFSADDPRVKASLRDYVTKGGKLYVTDWKQGFVTEGFPGYLNFAQARGCTGGGYDVKAIVKDPDLDAWLRAQGESNITLKKNYQVINGLQSIYISDGDGGTKVYQPKIWMSGNQGGSEKPQTVSFEYGCGRVLYSTYHTETSATAPLDAQEKALFYILFEVASTCVVDPVIPK